MNAAGEGKITGTVKLDGAAPHMKGIDMSKDPYCAKIHASDPGHLETYVVGSDGGLANVVLYISEGYSGPATVATTEPVFDQKGCMYTPHVLGLDVEQKFKVVTSDQTTHNIHPLPNPMTGNIPRINLSRPELLPWKRAEGCGNDSGAVQYPSPMHGWFAVVKGPYATSDAKGEYTINVPAGNYTVTAWHEAAGTQTQKVTVAAGGSGSANFTFKAK